MVLCYRVPGNEYKNWHLSNFTCFLWSQLVQSPSGVQLLATPWTAACQASRPACPQPARLLCPWNFPGKNTWVGWHLLLQAIFPTQELNLCLPHCGLIPYHLSHQRLSMISIEYDDFFAIAWRALLIVQMVKNLSATQESWVGSLRREDPLEKGMATHSSIPVWRIPWTEELDGLQPMGSQRVRHYWVTNTFTCYCLSTLILTEQEIFWRFSPFFPNQPPPTHTHTRKREQISLNKQYFLNTTYNWLIVTWYHQLLLLMMFINANCFTFTATLLNIKNISKFMF